MFDYVYTDHAQYTIKTYAKMALFPLSIVLTGPLSFYHTHMYSPVTHFLLQNGTGVPEFCEILIC